MAIRLIKLKYTLQETTGRLDTVAIILVLGKFRAQIPDNSTCNLAQVLLINLPFLLTGANSLCLGTRFSNNPSNLLLTPKFDTLSSIMGTATKPATNKRIGLKTEVNVIGVASDSLRSHSF
jgi:hypothetical protein